MCQAAQDDISLLTDTLQVVLSDLHAAGNREIPAGNLQAQAHANPCPSIPVAVDVTKRGAFGWLEKPHQDAALMDALANALAEAAAIGARHHTRREAVARWATLTPREKQVAPLLRQGIFQQTYRKRTQSWLADHRHPSRQHF